MRDHRCVIRHFPHLNKDIGLRDIECQIVIRSPTHTIYTADRRPCIFDASQSLCAG